MLTISWNSRFDAPSRLVFLLACGLILLTSSAFAQLTRGSMTGTVTDVQDKPMMGVDVTILNQETGISRPTTTNEAGVYAFPALEPGIYTIEFKNRGFETRKTTDIRVSSAQEVKVNAPLRISTAASTVTVTVPGVALNKTNSAVEMTLSERMLVEIPVGTAGPGASSFVRDVTASSILAPSTNRAPGQNGFASNGQRSRNASFTIDGLDNNDNTVTQEGTITPPEAVREFHIQLLPFSAEFGRNTGPQINIVTKSGTNQYHGEIWNFHRANWMEPLSLMNKRANLTETPRFVNNQFGGNLGGPIVGNKTFFFGLIQGNLLRKAMDASNSVSAVIPTQAGYNALLTAPLGSGQSTASRQGPLNSLSFLPEVYAQGAPIIVNPGSPTVPVNGTPIEVGTITTLTALPQNYWYHVVRIDHQLTPTDQVFYRYHFDNRNLPDSVDNLAFGPRWAADQLIQAQSHSVSYTKIFSPQFVNEAKVGYSRRDLNFPENDPVSATVNITNLFTLGGGANFPQRRLDEVYQFQNVSSYILGRQSFKFGVDLRRNILANTSGADTKGTWSFNDLQDFMNNSAFSLRQTVSNPNTFQARQFSQYYFFQDEAKVTRDLTVSLGIRYERSSVPFGLYGATDPAALAAGIPGPVKPDNNNWAPRVAFAYSPSSSSGIWETLLGNGQTSIRGGFGVTYDVLYHNMLITTASTYYPGAIASLISTPSLQDVYPTLLPKTGATIPAFSATSTVANVPVDAQNPTTHNWTLSVQRELGRNYIVELGYSGSRSYHLLRQSQSNPPILTQAQADAVIAAGSASVIPSTQARRVNPSWGSRQLIETAGIGAYHAGYMRFDRKFFNGLQIGANYTWSANFSDSDEPFRVDDQTQPGGYQVTTSSPNVPQDFRNYRNDWSRSVYDRPHRFSFHYIYEIPWFSGGSDHLRHMFGGWQASGFSDFQSGQPFTMRVGVDTVGNAANSVIPPGRPNLNPGGILIEDPDTGNLRTFTVPLDGTGIVTAIRNPAGTAFLANTMPTGGNLGRNTFRGPGFQNWNLGLMKRIAINDMWKLELRSDFVNLFNHNNFQNPEASMSSVNFGKNILTPITDTRQIQLSAKFKF